MGTLLSSQCETSIFYHSLRLLILLLRLLINPRRFFIDDIFTRAHLYKRVSHGNREITETCQKQLRCSPNRSLVNLRYDKRGMTIGNSGRKRETVSSTHKTSGTRTTAENSPSVYIKYCGSSLIIHTLVHCKLIINGKINTERYLIYGNIKNQSQVFQSLKINI